MRLSYFAPKFSFRSYEGLAQIFVEVILCFEEICACSSTLDRATAS